MHLKAGATFDPRVAKIALREFASRTANMQTVFDKNWIKRTLRQQLRLHRVLLKEIQALEDEPWDPSEQSFEYTQLVMWELR
jgi:glutaredoxin 2